MIGPEPTTERFFFLPNGALAVYDPEQKKLVIAREVTEVTRMVVSEGAPKPPLGKIAGDEKKILAVRVKEMEDETKEEGNKISSCKS